MLVGTMICIKEGGFIARCTVSLQSNARLGPVYDTENILCHREILELLPFHKNRYCTCTCTQQPCVTIYEEIIMMKAIP